MRRLSLFSLMLLSSCAIYAQQTVATGVEIRPNAAGTNSGYLTIYNATAAAFAKFKISTSNTVDLNAGFSPDTDLGYDIGTQAKRWKLFEGQQFTARSGSAGAGSSTTLCYMSAGGFTCDSGGTNTITLNRTTGGAALYSLSGAGTRCLQTDNDGLLAVASAGCATNPLTTTGDIIYSSGGTTAARLGIGTAGQCLVVTAGIPAWGSCSASSSPFIDSTAIIYGSGDATKLWRVEVDGITTGTTRVATPPNSDFTMAGINITQTFSANQTFAADILADANTRKIGDGTAFYQVRANRLEGMCSLCDSTTNFANTRKVNIYDQNGISDAGWDLMTYVTGVGGTSYITFRDNVGYEALRLSTWETTNIKQAKFSLSMMPTTDLAYDVGSQTGRWKLVEGQQFITRSGGAGAGSSTTLCYMSASGFVCDSGGTNTITLNRTSGAATLYSLSGSGTRCLQTDNSGLVAVASAACGTNPLTTTGDMIYSSSGSTAARLGIGSAGQYLTVSGGVPTWATLGVCSTCVTTSRTISTTSPLGGGGDLSADRTLTCTTCVTTAGGQSISGTTTVSTVSVSTAISGTYAMSGNGTVTGNWYERTFSGGNASCGGVSDGWLGIRTDTGGTSGKPEIQVCVGGAMKYSALN